MRKPIGVSIFLIFTLLLVPALELHTLHKYLAVESDDNRHVDVDERHSETLDAEGWIAVEHACPRAIPGIPSRRHDIKRGSKGTVAAVEHSLIDRTLLKIETVSAQLTAIFSLNAAPKAAEPPR